MTDERMDEIEAMAPSGLAPAEAVELAREARRLRQPTLVRVLEAEISKQGAAASRERTRAGGLYDALLSSSYALAAAEGELRRLVPGSDAAKEAERAMQSAATALEKGRSP